MLSDIRHDESSTIFDCHSNGLTDINFLIDKDYRFKNASGPRGTWHQVFTGA